MKTTRRALFGALAGAAAVAVGVTVESERPEQHPEQRAIGARDRVICGWPTDMARGLMPCVLAPNHPGTCLPAPLP